MDLLMGFSTLFVINEIIKQDTAIFRRILLTGTVSLFAKVNNTYLSVL